MTSFLLGYECKIKTLKLFARKTLGILSRARPRLMDCLELALRDDDQSAQVEGTYQTGLSLYIVISASMEVSIQLGRVVPFSMVFKLTADVMPDAPTAAPAAVVGPLIITISFLVDVPVVALPYPLPILLRWSLLVDALRFLFSMYCCYY